MLTLSSSRTHLLRDGRPFFWLADTAWNGICKATPDEWRAYLQTRAAQGFTAIQFVCTHWRAYDEEPAFTLGRRGRALAGPSGLRMNEDFYARRDPLVQMIRDHGLIPAPVLLWACTPRDPGQYLSEADAITVARYLVDRWGGDDTAYLLGGDGDYRGDKAPRWQRIGRAVFPQNARGAGVPPAHTTSPLVTMHPGGQMWVTEEFRHEPWFGFHGYQSGHGDSDDHLRWLLNGPPVPPWQADPVHPLINLEPNYETHISYHSQRRFTDHDVRRAAYWSLLLAPTAGVTYGNNSIWWWAREPGVPMDHANIGMVEPWHAGLDLPGVRSMAILRRFFDQIAWWTLRPAPDLLTDQPDAADPARHIALAANADRTLAVAYLPCGGTLNLSAELADLNRQWFDPRTGEFRDAAALTAPDERDWVLLLNGE
jgi:hypothetical protein